MKFLGNKLVLFSFVILIVGGLVAAPYLFPKHDGEVATKTQCDTCPCDSLSTPTYCKLRSKIIDFDKEPWSKQSYGLLKANINDYAKNGLINEEETNGLQKLLNAKYLGVLSTAIRQHCRTAATLDKGLVSEYESELRNVPVDDNMQATKNSLSQLLSNFKSACDFPNSVRNYLSTNPYSDSKTQQYLSQISNFQSTEEIGSNKALMQKVSSQKDYLTAFRTAYTRDIKPVIDTSKNQWKILKNKGDDFLNDLCTIKGLLNTHYKNIIWRLREKARNE